MNTSPEVKLTRINNACVLIQMGEHAILTDPYFINYKIVGIKEPVAMTPQELPPLTAIIGCHDVIDHWQMDGLKDYPHNKDDVRVFVAMKSQIKSTRKAGFNNVEVLSWGEKRIIGDLSIESVEAQKMMVWTVNNYVLRLGDKSVFFGSEARDIPPFSRYREEHGPVDVALLPVNAVHLMGFYKLVMSGAEAVNATRELGAPTLFVIHDAHPSIPGVIHIKSSGDDADASVVEGDSVEVIRTPPGFEWTLGQDKPFFAKAS